MQDMSEMLDGFPTLHGELTEYGRGWNDAVRSLREMLAKKHGQFLPVGHVALPTTQAEAEMMVLLGENWLKHNAPEPRKFTPRGKEEEIEGMKTKLGEEPHA